MKNKMVTIFVSNIQELCAVICIY